ncbi:bifunctional glutamate N-acetyltransferase/amino-acid acetyltransferase ArgJ [Terriglobus roseus]|uniref:Arginine biosynthesis bifunctional protein ArgJ n=1 Tax=Terriglobus roseus TaxID=392734 RepID=A0A1G7JS94_9BACT|nr:bifunctional glutamate N-acetyltransferase/amino-acid acetyltransferase ArgJ [Terriglobus roseus]SDF27837.1 glutamate N-acetyltransferase [Terriglobus roseus]
MPSLRKELPRGFRWAAVKAGIKASGRTDVAVAVADRMASAAVMFTDNQVVAAPVTVGRKHMAATQGCVKAVVVNAGNANCATGAPGIAVSEETCRKAAELFGCAAEEVIPSSTGIIGVPLPIEKLTSALPHAAERLAHSNAAAEAFATAIMTTDTKMKVSQATVEAAETSVRIFGCCKGAGMIGPQLGPPHATMLVYLFTDIAAEPAVLRELLQGRVEASFNSISVDGDTSTNDTVLLLASGASGVKWSDAPRSFQDDFCDALQHVCNELAHAIIDDGEGVTHVVTLEISGTANDADAKTIAKSIAHSPLCKTAWSSADPNWGRIIAAAGYAGVPFSPEETTVTIGGVKVFDRGVRAAGYDEAVVHEKMKQREYTIAVSVGSGPGRSRFLTCDLTVEYVHINADYST